MNNIKDRYEELYKIIIKDNITDIDKDIIKEKFKSLYEELILFLVGRKDSYYGYFLVNMELSITFEKDIIAGVSIFNKFPIILEINPLLLLRFDLNEIIFILCHEIEHLILLHPTEWIRLNPTNDPEISLKINYAADASVNEILLKEVNTAAYMRCPSNLVTSNTIKHIAGIDKIKNDESILYYYNLIKDKKVVSRIKFGLYNSNIGGEFNYKFDINEKSEVLKEFIKKCVESIPSNVRANLPLHQQLTLESVLSKPKLNWKQILKQYTGNVIHNKRKTKSRLNRRMPLRYDLSGTFNDYTVKIVVAIDTSGSMSRDDLMNVMSEIFEIVKNKKTDITLIQCDSEIENVYKVKSKKDVNLKIKGRGGTSFTPVIEYLNKNKYYKDAILIYFTDGHGEKEIPKPNLYRLIWVVLGGEKNLSLSNSYGVTLPLEI